LSQAEDRQGNLRVLHGDLHLEKFNSRDAPHSLEADQKRPWVERSGELLQILGQDQQYELEHIRTKDESWFFLNIFIIRARRQIQMACLKFRSKKESEKCLISITRIKKSPALLLSPGALILCRFHLLVSSGRTIPDKPS
jgi:hypothetical protein